MVNVPAELLQEAVELLQNPTWTLNRAGTIKALQTMLAEHARSEQEASLAMRAEMLIG